MFKYYILQQRILSWLIVSTDLHHDNQTMQQQITRS